MKSIAPISSLFLLSTACLFSALLNPSARADSQVPQQASTLLALHQGQQELNARHWELAEKQFETALSDLPIRHWAIIGKAEALLGQGRTKDALSLLEGVSKTSAARPDAELLLLMHSPSSNERSGVTALERELRELERWELYTKLYAWKLFQEFGQGQASAALDSYQLLRPLLFLHDPSEIILNAQKRSEIFENLLNALSPTQQDQLLFFEAQQRYKEKDFLGSRRLLTRCSAARQAMLEAVRLHSKLLASEGKKEEARRVLQKAADECKTPQKEEIELELAKGLWNENKLPEARTLLKQLKQKSSQWINKNEIAYIHARTWIDEGKLGEGKQELELLGNACGKKSADEHTALALREIAWLALRQHKFSDAARGFERYLDCTKERIQQALALSNESERKKALRDARFEKDHATFWRAESCVKAGPQSLKLKTCHKNAQRGFREVLRESPLGYYAYLSAKRLGEKFPSDAMVQEARQAEASSLEACKGFPINEIAATGARLAEFPFSSLAGREISTFLRRHPTGTQRLSCRVALSLRFHDEPTAIRLADEQLRNDYRALSSPDRSLFLLAAFQAPYTPLYQAETKRRSVPLEFALAISRTESFFAPLARSSSDARGIMQLLPQTARREGLEDALLLFRPEDNIPVGVKHLSTLLQETQGNVDFSAAAYNAGPSALKRWQSRKTLIPGRDETELESIGIDAWIETIPYGETRNYIKKVRLASSWYARRHSLDPLSEPRKSKGMH